MDIIKLVSTFATPAVLEKVAGMLGVPPGALQKGLAAAVPGVLASLLGAAKQPGITDTLGSALSQSGGLGDLLGSDPAAAATKGGGLLSQILGGDGAGKLADALGGYAGLPKAGAGSLLGLAGSMALGALGKQASESNLDAEGVLGLLSSQKDQIAGALPADFAKALSGSGLLGDLAPAVAAAPAAAAAAAPRPQPPRTPPPPPPAKSGWMKWLIWLIVLALVAWLLLRWLSPTPEPVTEAPAPAAPEAAAPEAAAPEPAPAAEPAPEPEPEPAMAPEEPAAAPAPADSAAAPADDPLVVGGVDVGAQVSGALDSLASSFAGITDAATAEAALPRLTEARDTLGGLESTVSALPAEGRTALQGLVSAALPTLQSSADTLLADSAVAGVVKPVVDEILAKLRAFAA